MAGSPQWFIAERHAVLIRMDLDWKFIGCG
jgi:hypothetical protein